MKFWKELSRISTSVTHNSETESLKDADSQQSNQGYDQIIKIQNLIKQSFDYNTYIISLLNMVQNVIGILIEL